MTKCILIIPIYTNKSVIMIDIEIFISLFLIATLFLHLSLHNYISADYF